MSLIHPSVRCFTAHLVSVAVVGAVTFLPVAQSQTFVPVPFVTTSAGLPAGGSGTACSNDIPNTFGTHLGDGCSPTQATLTSLYGAFTDAVGNVYVTENGTNNDIRVIYKGGAALTATLIAANATLSNFTPTPGFIYTLAGARPSTLTVKNGTKFSCDGTTTGPQALDSAGDGCPATQAYLKPRGMFVDPSGNIFLVSTGGGNVVKVIYAGGTQVASLITTENPGVTPQVGYVYQLSGQSTASYNGDGGLAKAAALVVVRDIVVDSYGNIFVSDGTTPGTAGGTNTTAGNNVRVIYGGVKAPAGLSNLTTGYIYTYAGGSGCAQGSSSCTAGYSGDGGPATSALFNAPYTLFLDRYSNLYISDYTNGRLRVVYSGGSIPGITNPTVGYVYTYAGGGTSTLNGAAANQVKLGIVSVSGTDAAGNIYVEDGTAKNIWRFDAITGIGYVSAGAAGVSHAGVACSGTSGPLSSDNFGDGCPATQAAVSDIGRVSFDSQGNWYLGENGNGIVRRFSNNTQFPSTPVGSSVSRSLAYLSLSSTTLTTESFLLQGGVTSEFSDAGSGTCALPSTLSAAQTCVFNVSFTPLHAGLREGTQQLSTATAALNTALLSGVGLASDLAIDPATESVAGTGLTPSGIASDLLGNVYVADSTGNRLLKGTKSGTTLTSLVTGLKNPSGVALDASGNVYIADGGNNRVLEVNSAGATLGSFGNSLNNPSGVAVDAFGNIFISDTGNNRVVEVTANGLQFVPPLTGLSTPTQLSFDSSGDLFVIDSGNSRLVELPANSDQTTVALPSGVVPAGVSVDNAGTIYVLDSTSKQVQAYPPRSSSEDTLFTGLTKPSGLAADPDGTLYVADKGATGAIILRRDLGNITFPITNVNSSSVAGINLSNVGNTPLNFLAPPLFTLTSPSAFSILTATTNGCSGGVSYAPGGGCNFTASFNPTAKGVATANASFKTDATNTGSVAAALAGTGEQLVATTTTVSASPGGGLGYGQAVTLTATVTPNSNAGAASGTIAFTVDGKTQAPLPYGAGTVTLTLQAPAVGTHTVSVSFSGDANYASSAASTSFTVNKAVSTTSLTVAPQNSNGTITLIFSAGVTSATATGETGSVSFYAGTQLLTTLSLSAATLTATYTSSTFSYANNSFTAVYSGDGNFAGSTSPALNQSADFAIGTSTPSITIPQGGVANVGYVISALYGGTGSISPSCSGLPVNATCTFQPTTIALSGSTSVQMLIYTNVNANQATNLPPLFRGDVAFAALLPFTLLLVPRQRRKLGSAILASLVLALAIVSLSGCNTGSIAAQSNQGLQTPAGTSNITVKFSGVSPLATHTNSFTLTVLPNNTGF